MQQNCFNIDNNKKHFLTFSFSHILVFWIFFGFSRLNLQSIYSANI